MPAGALLETSARHHLTHPALVKPVLPVFRPEKWSGDGWRLELEFIEQHGLLSRLLESLPHDAVPAECLAAIHRRAEASARRAMWLTAELIRILDHLEGQHIPVMAWK